MPRSARGAGNTLVKAPALDADADARIYDLLGETPAETELLVISYRDGPDTWLADWHQQIGRMPADLGFIHVGETTRSAATSSAGDATQSPFGFVDAVGNPADLTELGIQTSKYLERWAGTANTITVYVDSLTSMLQFVELNKAYRFLHVFGGRIESVDGFAFYRLDPDAHNEQTIATVQNVMDDVWSTPR